MSDVAKTPREDLKCKKKYLYEYSMFWECNDGSKCQILEDDVVRLLNEQQATIEQLRTQLLICHQSKSDDGRFQVWQVPPIPKGMRITSFTTSDGEIDE